MNISQDLSHALQELGQCFLQEFLEVEIARHPGNLKALAELGQVYTTRGLWERGLATDQRLVGLLPADPTAHYNLACSHALLGEPQKALAMLICAVDRGYNDAPHMLIDEDLASLREEPLFRALVERIRSRD